MSKVSIATKPLVYSAFRYLSNKVYNALAEYVDNSIQSFQDHKDILKKINPNGKVEVRITIDPSADLIRICDNAFGIDELHYQRAFELANIPLDASGLNEFGMGMKVSSIWLSNNWSVETSAYGENTVKTVEFNLKDVVDNSRLDLEVDVKPAKINQHYTIITLQNLSQNKPAASQLNNIKKHLASIYIDYIRQGVLDLFINDNLVEIETPEILVSPYYKTPNGEEITWRKDINFKVPKPGGGYYSVIGFIGILKEMSTNDKNGFMLFRRGRVIGTSGENKYRPKILCGSVGSPQYKRIFGELFLEGFDVSFTKNAFNEDEDFESFIEALAYDIANSELDFFSQAENYRKPKDKVPQDVLAKNVTKTLAKAFKDKTIIKQVKQIPVEQNHVTTIDSSLQNKVDLFGKVPEIIDEVSQIVEIDGVEYKLKIQGVNNSSQMGLYNLSITSGNNYEATFNLENPFFERHNEIFEKPESIEPICDFIKTMVAAEISLQQSDGDFSGKIFRDKFNSLFGNI